MSAKPMFRGKKKSHDAPWSVDPSAGMTLEEIEENLESLFGFVYELHCHPVDKRYIGQKRFWKKVTKEKVKRGKDGKPVGDIAVRKKKIKTLEESDWKKYWGSSSPVDADLRRFGKEKFSRKIIAVVKRWGDDMENGAGSLSYQELTSQLSADALRRADYYNGIINVRLSRRAVFPSSMTAIDDCEVAARYPAGPEYREKLLAGKEMESFYQATQFESKENFLARMMKG